jgi:hypothetical protein
MSEGMRPLPLRNKEELSDLLGKLPLHSVVGIRHAPHANGMGMAYDVGLYCGIANDTVYLSSRKVTRLDDNDAIPIPIADIRKVIPYGTKTPYLIAYSPIKPPRRRRAIRTFKAEDF